MDRGLLTTALIGFLTPIVLFAPFNPAKAGFFDWLFGRREPAAVSGPARPDVTIRASAHRAPARQKIARKKAAPAAKPVPAIDPKEQLARTIDPARTPDWWLVDPTLKRGDILFLKDRVVVFVGGKPGKLASYAPVSQTRLVSLKERRLIVALSRGQAPSAANARTADAQPERARRRVVAALR